MGAQCERTAIVRDVSSPHYSFTFEAENSVFFTLILQMLFNCLPLDCDSKLVDVFHPKAIYIKFAILQ